MNDIGLVFFANIPSVTSGTAALTHFQILAATSYRLELLEMYIRTAGILGTDAAGNIEFLRRSGGTFSALASTGFAKLDPLDSRSITTTVGYNASAEPSYVAGDLVTPRGRHPQAASEIPFSFTHPIPIINGTPLNCRMTFPSTSIAVITGLKIREIKIA